jgi:CspA family cold shock protein
MTHFGKIKSYDSGKGAGTISPEEGGDVLPFGKSDLQQESQAPKVGDRYGFETNQVDGHDTRAVNLQRHQVDLQQEQARAQ